MPRTIAKKRGASPAGDALRALKLRRIEDDARLPESIYNKDDLAVVQAVEKTLNAHESMVRALRGFLYKWGPTVRAATRAPAASFPPAPTSAATVSGIRTPKTRTVSITSPGGGTAQGGGHAPRPTFPPSATSGTGKPANPKKGSRR